MRKNSDQPKRVLALEFGPKLIELRASYLERRQETGLLLGKANDDVHETRWGRYANVLATSF